MMAFSQLLSAVLLLFFIISFGGCRGKGLRVILGDSVTFPGTENCTDLTRVERIGELSAQPVATCKGGVWEENDEYTDRTMNGSSFAFKRTVYTDAGTYELVTSSSTTIIQLDVVWASKVSVSDGEELRLPCYIIAGNDGTIRWEKNGKTVLDFSLSTNKITYGNVSLSSAAHKEGDWSLIFHRARSEDGGDYFCFAINNAGKEEKGNPAAVRVQINKRNPDQKTIHTPLAKHTEEKMNSGTSVAIAVTGKFVIPLLIVVFVWWWRSR